MELYKIRGFGEFFQDTFSFLKQHGKHFFKEYFIINGIFLLILSILGYFFAKFYSEILFNGALQNNDISLIDNYLNENLGIVVILFFAFLIVIIVAGSVSYVFPAIYLKLYIEKGGSAFETNAIINAYKANIGKLIIFIICSIILAIPLVFVFAIAAFVLTITIVGIVLLPFLLGAFLLFYYMALMEYLEGKKGVWESFGYSWTLLISKFWAAVGSVGLLYLMAYIIQNVVSLIPYLFGMASLFTVDEGSPSTEEVTSVMMIVLLLVFFISFILGTILGNIVQLNQGIIFYSLKEQNENINTKSIIDQIGSSE